MSWVAIDGLHVAYGETAVLDGVQLDIPRGSLTAVLGPSGCGKTTLLRAIAGLLPATGGTIRVGERLLSSPTRQLAPEKRGVGWVPQDASLFPHLTVGENIAFGLTGRSARRAGLGAGQCGQMDTRRGAGLRGGVERQRLDRKARVAELAELVGLTAFIDRAPSQLSGGQAQRVALARALAPRPDLVLLDEPFAALDPQLRASLRREVADLLRAQSNTSILVTHDQEEALSLADYVAVMRDGRILQWGTPWEVYERPVSRWVAAFVGDTVELDGRWADGRVDCPLGSIDAEASDGALASEGQPVRLMLRPEWLEVAPGGDSLVTSVAYAGHDALVSVSLPNGTSVRARVAAPILPQRGDRVRVSVRHRALAYPVGAATVGVSV
ncbi:ABC transporter ATP-binding protein [Arthrobacter sp. H5]|uniref:ABC transporter ATP-binding protein n=1 Tax=Arthrobacter sp. H5 TaxID=1267973 RepID=UPI000488D5AD|nr:ABC transporter ATP-binding protein [Arthrobacter sp. H5]